MESSLTFHWEEWTARTSLRVEAPLGPQQRKYSRTVPWLYGRPAAIAGREVLEECQLLLQFYLKMETHLGGSRIILSSLNDALTLET